MNLEKIVQTQYRQLANRLSGRAGELGRPKEGWLKTVRTALGMSGADVATRLGLTRARVSQTEAAELTGGVTLKTMTAFAEAMGCRFVYAIVPAEGKVEDIIKAQALRQAAALVQRAGIHMALEDQSISKAATKAEIARIADEYARKMPPGFWREP
jgi:predicted DNA-binding mobile mystery protein A